MSIVPDAFIRTARRLRGPKSEPWLAALPGIVAACREEWSLTLGPPFPRLTFNYAAPATRADGTAAVLKVCLPDREYATEAAALRLFDGRGSVRLLEHDLARGALLLERLEPGTLLRDVADDAEATTIAAGVMRQLWRPVPPSHPFPSVADWARGLTRLRQQFAGGTGPLPEALVAQAESLFADLLASQTETALLHGDLHHDNILAAGRAPWLAIDPKGIVGDPAYETAVFIRNPDTLFASPHAGRVLARRIDQLSEELTLDRARVRGWAMAHAVLSLAWSVEDEGQVPPASLACAELLAVIA